MPSKISESLENTLKKTDPKGYLNVIIFATDPGGEEKEKREKLPQSLEPIVKYLERIRVKFTPSPSLGLVSAFLNRTQIFELAKEKYVAAIMDDQMGIAIESSTKKY
ncbi:hypothetical protein HZA33_05075 [Candidatus Pacearchaeota archaeon]|nr:hypothetical protein [Candidatus Pacearchaeota archaeon]